MVATPEGACGERERVGDFFRYYDRLKRAKQAIFREKVDFFGKTSERRGLTVAPRQPKADKRNRDDVKNDATSTDVENVKNDAASTSTRNEAETVLRGEFFCDRIAFSAKR